MGKQDSMGTYAYVCDGTTPDSPVLSDGHAIYTGGVSENRSGVISFRHDDALGSVRFTTTGQAVVGRLTSEAFGAPVDTSGSLPTPLRFVGGSGCQTDADFGLVLMGHRYYDTRIGRFLSQDPAGDGDNWYAYAENDPVNKTDVSGLTPMDGPGSSPLGSPGYNNVAGAATAGAYYDNEILTQYNITHTWTEVKGLNGDWSRWQHVGGSDTYSIAADDFNPFNYDFYPKDGYRMVGNIVYNVLAKMGSYIIPFASSGPGAGSGNKDNETVREILKRKRGSIKGAPLDKGSPSWQDIQDKKWEDIVKGAEGRQPGYDTFKKLLTDGRFKK